MTKRGAFTNWKSQREGQVRTQKERDRARGAHVLETTEGGTSQAGHRKEVPSEGRSRPGDHRGRDKSGHR